jgi:hypothetical protein
VAAISAQDATITLGGNSLADVVSYEAGVAVRFNEPDLGTVRVQALSNNVLTSRRTFTQRRRLVIRHGGVTTFDAWVFVRSARVAAVTNDVVRYTFDFAIVSVPLLS